jgi:hypothetical protein
MSRAGNWTFPDFSDRVTQQPFSYTQDVAASPERVIPLVSRNDGTPATVQSNWTVASRSLLEPPFSGFIRVRARSITYTSSPITLRLYEYTGGTLLDTQTGTTNAVGFFGATFLVNVSPGTCYYVSIEPVAIPANTVWSGDVLWEQTEFDAWPVPAPPVPFPTLVTPSTFGDLAVPTSLGIDGGNFVSGDTEFLFTPLGPGPPILLAGSVITPIFAKVPSAGSPWLGVPGGNPYLVRAQLTSSPASGTTSATPLLTVTPGV